MAIPACDCMFCVVVGWEVSYIGGHTFPGYSFAWAAVYHDVSLIWVHRGWCFGSSSSPPFCGPQNTRFPPWHGWVSPFSHKDIICTIFAFCPSISRLFGMTQFTPCLRAKVASSMRGEMPGFKMMALQCAHCQRRVDVLALAGCVFCPGSGGLSG